ncbi:MAG: hypothetical protein PHS57_10460 [Alphaproteobacteria bacterium]|nr:hypothetical protein [Alphaproteobacteria bacterium]
MMGKSVGRQWADLCDELKAILHDKINLPLFSRGEMQLNELQELEELEKKESKIREKMKQFLKEHV